MQIGLPSFADRLATQIRAAPPHRASTASTARPEAETAETRPPRNHCTQGVDLLPSYAAVGRAKRRELLQTTIRQVM